MPVFKVYSKIKFILLLMLVLLSAFFLIFYSKECVSGVLRGTSFCLTVLVPSLFLFMVLSEFIVKSGLAQYIGKFPWRIFTKLFGLPGCCFSAIIMTVIGGFPVGAKTVHSLYHQGLIDEKSAEKLAYYTVCAGPGFLINYIGCALLNNKSAGFILLSAQTLSVLLLGIISNRIFTQSASTLHSGEEKNMPLSCAFVQSVRSGSISALSMCSTVIVFSAIIAVSNSLLKNYPTISKAVTAMLEVTTACNTLLPGTSLVTIAFIVGFGGICVHFQVFSALSEIKISKAIFFLFRIIGGILTALFTYILLMVFPTVSTVFSSYTQPLESGFSTTIWGCAALIITAVCFLFSVNSAKKQEE